MTLLGLPFAFGKSLTMATTSAVWSSATGMATASPLCGVLTFLTLVSLTKNFTCLICSARCFLLVIFAVRLCVAHDRAPGRVTYFLPFPETALVCDPLAVKA